MSATCPDPDYAPSSPLRQVEPRYGERPGMRSTDPLLMLRAQAFRAVAEEPFMACKKAAYLHETDQRAFEYLRGGEHYRFCLVTYARPWDTPRPKLASLREELLRKAGKSTESSDGDKLVEQFDARVEQLRALVENKPDDAYRMAAFLYDSDKGAVEYLKSHHWLGARSSLPSTY